MIAENSLIDLLFRAENVLLIFKVGYILFAALYFIFSLIVISQVRLMTETVMTEGGSLLRALSILHAGFALTIVILFIGFL